MQETLPQPTFAAFLEPVIDGVPEPSQREEADSTVDEAGGKVNDISLFILLLLCF